VSALFILAAGAAFACHQPRAIDGDTLRCGAETVRLQAINARELHGNSCAASAPCPPASAAKGKAALQALLDQGPVACTPTGQDRYGRTVARCSVGGSAAPGIRGQQGVDLSCALVRTGAAAEWRKYGRAC
jgi:endonuclease YncB( thermonuclease family)